MLRQRSDRGRQTPPSSQRSRSVKPDLEQRPAWDDTNQDTQKLKATVEQIARRKELRTSKHMMTPDAMRNSMASGWGRDQEQPSPAPVSPMASLEGAQDAGQPGISPTPSPAIDYQAVLKLMNQGQGRRTSASRTPASAQGDSKPPAGSCGLSPDMAMWPGNALGRADVSPAASGPGQGGMGLLNSLSSSAWILPTPGTASPPAPSQQQGAQPSEMSGGGQLHEAQLRHFIHGCDEVLNATLGALGRGEAAPPTPAPAPALSPAPPTGQASQSLPSQLARLAHVEADVEARLVRVEAAVEEAQEAVGEMQELRRAAKALQAEQAALRGELCAFTRHASGLMASLQGQLTQLLLRQPDCTPAPALALAPAPSPAPLSSMQRQLSLHKQSSHPEPTAAMQEEQAWGLQALGHDSPRKQAWMRLAPPEGSMAGHTLMQATQQVSRGPNRSLFQDLPPVPPTAPAASRAGGEIRATPTPSAVPVSTFDEQLTLPSYASMRRSTQALPPPLTQAPYQPQPQSQWPGSLEGRTVSGLYSAQRVTGDERIQPSPALEYSAQGATGEGWAGSTAWGRSMPSALPPRALGGAPLQAGGLAGMLAAAGGDLSSLGIQLPTSLLGEGTEVGRWADYVARGQCSSFGSHLEPMTFDTTDTFKISRVGGPAMSPGNSLSLAAHTQKQRPRGY